VNLESVRITRDPTGIRVDLTFLGLPEERMFSVVEAATGVYGSRMLRAALVRGFGQRVVLTGSYDAVATQGWAFQSPFSLVSTQAALSYALSPRTGLQIEVRNTGVQRTGAAMIENADRSILFVRGRTALTDNLVVDAGVGRAWRNPADNDQLTVPLAASQAFARAKLFTDAGSLEGLLRLRSPAMDASGRPGLEAAGRAELRLLPMVSAEGEARVAGAGAANILGRGTLRVGPARGPSLFAGLTAGRYDVPLVADVPSIDPEEDDEQLLVPRYSTVASSGSSLRAGASWSSGEGGVHVAGVALPATTVAPFGVAFDRGLGELPAGAAQGIEAQLSLGVPRTGGALRLEGWGEYWVNDGDRFYLPIRQAHVGAVANRIFYGGQLEPLARFQVIHRGPMSLPTGEAGSPGLRTAQYTLANLLIQIRIMDLQIFGLWENAFDYRAAADIPGLQLPGLRLVYGFRWVFSD
jgi:hypothetical protein